MSEYRCWSCDHEHEQRVLFCEACERLQPPLPDQDHFTSLQLPPSFQLGPDVLEQSFKRLSRRLHPDRFVTASERERRYSLEHATAVNDAYRLLRIPVRRAEYLLERWGRKLSDASGRSRPLDLEFMEALLELREAVADARFEEDQTRMHALLEAAHEEWRKHYSRVQALFSQVETQAAPEADAAMLNRIEAEVMKLRYLHNALMDHGINPTPEATSNG